MNHLLENHNAKLKKKKSLWRNSFQKVFAKLEFEMKRPSQQLQCYTDLGKIIFYETNKVCIIDFQYYFAWNNYFEKKKKTNVAKDFKTLHLVLYKIHCWKKFFFLNL